MRVYSRELKEHLPHLRRYARALTGSTEYGDHLVTRCIEAAVMAPTRFGLPSGARSPLYALLHTLFDGNGMARPARTMHPVEAALRRLSEDDRRLYLLVTLEELSVSEAARILDLEAGEAGRRLFHAREIVREALTARIMVVEDNAIVAIDISEVIAGMGHVVCGTAATEKEAFALISDGQPTLALLDIRLAQGGSGIAVAQKLRDTFELPVIFVTGYAGDLRLMDLEHLGPVIEKPYTAEDIRRAITHAVFTPREPYLASHVLH